MNKDLRIVGGSRPIFDAYNKVTGRTCYTNDMKFRNMLYGKLVLSEKAHARVVAIDTSEAEKIEGVMAIATPFNTSNKKYNSALRFADHDIPKTETIFSEVVRFVGDRVCAVAAIDQKTADKAAKLIRVEYEELPAVLSIEEALAENAIQLHDNVDNRLNEITNQVGDVEKGFALADHIFEDEYRTPIVSPMAMENHVSIADFDDQGKLTIYSSTQNAFSIRNILSDVFDLPQSKVRVVKPTLGGAFGSKIPAVLEGPAAALSMMTHRPVKINLTRKENLIATRTRHGSIVRIKTGVMQDGTIVAQQLNVLTNTGAYVGSAYNVVGAMSHKVFKTYKIPNMVYSGTAVLTNLPIAGAMRGYGSPQAIFAQQRQIHAISQRLGIDIVELQRKNLVRPEEVDSEKVGNPRPLDCMERGLELFDWKAKNKWKLKIKEENNLDLRKEHLSSARKIKRGIGFAVGCHGNGVFGAHRDFIGLRLKLNDDGTMILQTGTHDMGNSLITSQMMIVAEELGLEVEDIAVVESDTDLTPWNLGDYSSRGVFVTGVACIKVASKMREKLFSLASEMLKEPKNTLTLIEGKKIKSKSGKEVTFAELLLYSHREHEEDVMVSASYGSIAGRTSFGAHFAQVEVDTESGTVRILDYVAVHDVGQAINRLSLEGQLEGGIQMGLGYALSEEMVFDEKGRLKNNNLKKYKMFKASMMPDIKIDFIEEGETPGPYGGKSIGECATVPVAPAVVNAIANALDCDFHCMPRLMDEQLKIAECES